MNEEEQMQEWLKQECASCGEVIGTIDNLHVDSVQLNNEEIVVVLHVDPCYFATATAVKFVNGFAVYSFGDPDDEDPFWEGPEMEPRDDQALDIIEKFANEGVHQTVGSPDNIPYYADLVLMAGSGDEEALELLKREANRYYL